MPVQNRNSEFLISHNRLQSDLFQSPDEVEGRDEYTRRHKAHIMVTKCMDGRMNIPVITGIPMGIISPYRSMGGKLDIGSPGFSAHVRNFHNFVADARRQDDGVYGLVASTYHYSKGDAHRGCRGFNYDTGAARQYARRLKQAFEFAYGRSHALIHPISMGVETDEEALVIHGDMDEAQLCVADACHLSPDELRRELRVLFPNMHAALLDDLLPMVVGNAAHVTQLRQKSRKVFELDHRETTLCVGRGFDWLHLPNKALIVGPFSIDWPQEVVVAAQIILANLRREEELARQGATLLISAPFRDMGVDAAVAQIKAHRLAEVSWQQVRQHVPELMQDFSFDLLVGTLDRRTLSMRWLDTNPEEF